MIKIINIFGKNLKTRETLYNISYNVYMFRQIKTRYTAKPRTQSTDTKSLEKKNSLYRGSSG